MIDYALINLAIALCSVTVLVVLTLKNVFLKIRRKFKIRVSCWFCPASVPSFWVPYDNYNSFNCIHCGQYNGFKEDGDYNCPIKAQHHKSLNSTTNSVRSEEDASQQRVLNGLCTLCNRNQELKISQLASYVPEFEDNYDYEIEEYSKKLEQCYKLCPSCERTVKRSLVNVKRNIMGNFAQKFLNKTRIEDINEVRQLAAAEKRKQWLLRGALYSLLALALTNLYACLSGVDISRAELERIFPPTIVNGIVMTVAHFTAVKALLMRGLCENSVTALCRTGLDSLQLAFLWISDTVGIYQTLTNLGKMFADLQIVGLSGLAVNFFVISISKPANREGMLYSMLTWIASLALASATVTEMYSPVIGLWTLVLIKVIISSTNAALALHSLNHTRTSQNVANLNTSLHKIHQDGSDDEMDNSDAENDVSYQSTSSIKSTPLSSLNSTIRRPMSVKSFTSTPRLTPAVLRTFEKSQNTYESSLNGSFFGNGVDTQSFSRVPTLVAAPSFRSEVHEDSVAKCKATGYDESMFRDNIDRLSIGDAKFRQGMQPERSANPFYKIHDDSRPQTPSDFTYCVRQRTPPQLIPTAAPVSWIAGGYWTQSSPQKHQKFEAPQENGLGFFPIMSRTSSQSSGFESHGPNSRENSVFPDTDRFSVYSEPSKHQFYTPVFGFNRIEKTSNYSTANNRPHLSMANAPPPLAPSPVYSQFGTQRLTSSLGATNPNGFLRKGSIFNLDKINSNLKDTS